jgi:hypothetical protein
MPRYDLKVVVEYFYEVEAENESEANDLGWHYEDYAFSGEVYSIQVTEIEEEEIEEEFESDQAHILPEER